jgi:hypothetical protein
MGEQEGQPAVVVHAVADVRAALAAAGPRGVLLLSAPGAAAWLGAPLFRAMVAAAAAEFPSVPHRALLDCAGDPGYALAALAAGCALVRLDPTVPAWPVVAATAAGLGALLLAERPPALDLAALDLRRAADRLRLQAWLATG